MALSQQILNLWRPVNSISYTIGWLGAIALVFLTFGIVIRTLSDRLFEVTVRYDDVCGSQRSCSVEFSLANEVNAPVFFYYYLSSFHQNLRKSFNSKSYSQLEGKALSVSDASSCEPIVTNSQLQRSQSLGNNFLDTSSVAYPCGGMARSFFNGTLQ